jgi:hypothetical protein
MQLSVRPHRSCARRCVLLDAIAGVTRQRIGRLSVIHCRIWSSTPARRLPCAGCY